MVLLRLNVPVSNFSVMSVGVTNSWVFPVLFRKYMYLAQGHNTAEVGLEPPTSRSRVRGSATRPPCSRDNTRVTPIFAQNAICACEEFINHFIGTL